MMILPSFTSAVATLLLEEATVNVPVRSPVSRRVRPVVSKLSSGLLPVDASPTAAFFRSVVDSSFHSRKPELYLVVILLRSSVSV